MIKKFLGLIVLIIFAAVAVFFVGGNIILAKALEAAVGAPVKVGKFHIGLSPFEVGIYGLEIKNPSGFMESQMASLPEIFIQIDLASVFQNKIHVKEIRLNVDQITVERNAQGAVNLMEIGAIKNAKGKPGQPTPSREAPSRPEKEPSASGKPAQAQAARVQIQIDRVQLSLGRARYVDYGLGGPLVREFPLDIRNAVLTNVTDPSEITQQIVFKTLQKIGLNALLPNLHELGMSWDAQSASVLEGFKESLNGLKEKFKF